MEGSPQKVTHQCSNHSRLVGLHLTGKTQEATQCCDPVRGPGSCGVCTPAAEGHEMKATSKRFNDNS